jgi:hypothetical protein
MTLFILSILLSAFLIFQVQPLVGKLILPWFGGTSAVWSAVLMFFQVLLTGGYAYAYWLLERRSSQNQTRIHLALVGATTALIFVLAWMWPSPITPDRALASSVLDKPILGIFSVLALSVGLPYFLLATNSTLIQAWFNQRMPGRSPYWLYAVSNAGSLLALLTYPVLSEPNFTLETQGWLWSACFILFSWFTIAVTFRHGRHHSPVGRQIGLQKKPDILLSRRLLWVALSATASVLLLATTSRLTQEVAPIPFLWVLPLAVYLLTFVLAFSGNGRYRRPFFTLLLVAASLGIVAINALPDLDFYIQIGAYLFFLFAACLTAHGELYKLRPAASSLSGFYLLVSIGGALGGITVNLIAPLVFNGYWEFYIGWAALMVLLTLLLFIRRTEGLQPRLRTAHDIFVGLAAGLVLAYTIAAIAFLSGDTLYQDRNFYGVSMVYHDTENNSYRFVHGTTIHGVQFIDPDLRQTPTAYFWEGSGIARIIRSHPLYGEGMEVGVLGLGIGTLAAHARPGDHYRFYEINPDVIALASGEGGYFSYLEDSPAEIEIISGDARIQLESELSQGEIHDFDLLVMDAFSSDSVPVHLLTREAFQVYLQHLSDDGIIAVNITNLYLDLEPVVWMAAQEFGLSIAHFQTDVPPGNQATFYSEWILLSPDPDILQAPEIVEAADFMDGFSTSIHLWTDDYSNLFQIIKR